MVRHSRLRPVRSSAASAIRLSEGWVFGASGADWRPSIGSAAVRLGAAVTAFPPLARERLQPA